MTHLDMDLVDGMQWEDLTDKVEFITLEVAGLEETANDSAFDCVSLHVFLDWFYDQKDHPEFNHAEN